MVCGGMEEAGMEKGQVIVSWMICERTRDGAMHTTVVQTVGVGVHAPKQMRERRPQWTGCVRA